MNVAILSLAFLFAGPVFFNPIRSYAADRIKIALTTVGGSFWPVELPQRKDFFSKKH